MTEPLHSPEEARRVLELRAAELARPQADLAAAEATVELLELVTAGAGYAVEAAHVVEVLRRPVSTPVPRTSDAVLGVINHRGRIVALVDVGVVLGAPPPLHPAAYAVVVADGDATFALRADSVSVRELAVREVASAADVGEEHDPIVAGLTPELAAIVDIATLARDRRIRVDDAPE